MEMFQKSEFITPTLINILYRKGDSHMQAVSQKKL